MRIEIDTKNDTKKELALVANMLKALSSGHSEVYDRDAMYERRLDKLGDQGGVSNIFEDNKPGLMNIFSDAQVEPAPKSDDLFSIFSNDKKEETRTESKEEDDVLKDIRLVTY